MKLDDSAVEHAKQLGEALIAGAKDAADRLEGQARDAAEELAERTRAVVALNKGDEGTLLGTAAAIYAKEFTARDEGYISRDDRRLGWPLALLELRFANQHVVQFCADRDIDHDLPPGRYRALLVFTRID